jgi:DNA-binding MarR family transcriptional regulator
MTGRPLSDYDYESLARFRHALRRFLAFSEEAARGAGLTPAQHQLLLAVRGHASGAPSTSDVAEALQVKLHSATELVQRAEVNGLLRRTSDPTDARRAVLRLTPEGERQLATLSLVHREELRRFRGEMNEVLRELDRTA